MASVSGYYVAIEIKVPSFISLAPFLDFPKIIYIQCDMILDFPYREGLFIAQKYVKDSQ